MTTNATAIRELNIQQICTQAYRMAGLANINQELSTAQAAHAMTCLELVVDSLQNEGIIARSVGFYLLTLTAGEDLYSMPATTMAIIGDAMYQPAGEADTEHPTQESLVSQRSLEDWHLTANKDDTQTGTPQNFTVIRTSSPLQVRFWQTPAAAGAVNFRIQRLLGDNNDGTATPDVERSGFRYLTYATAHEIAVSAGLPIDRVMYLNAQSEKLLRKYRGVANEQGDRQFVLNHPTAWSR